MEDQVIFSAVDLMDRFISKNVIEIEDFQLLGVTCLMIYGKIFDVYPPILDDWVEICDGAYEREDLIMMEV